MAMTHGTRWRHSKPMASPSDPWKRTGAAISAGSVHKSQQHIAPCSSRYVEARSGPPSSNSKSVVTVCATR